MATDFFDIFREKAERFNGTSPTDNQIANAFPLYGPEQRVGLLQRLDEHIENSDPRDIRGAARLLRLQREWETAHRTLLDVGR
jgi:hypothetical protein